MSDSKLYTGKTYENSYVLNIEKSLKKKYETTQRSEIEYSFTGGGITAKLDTVSFELFIFACETYFDTCNKTTAKDKTGNEVQYTYQITDSTNLSFTINAYLTKCTLLINGKDPHQFIHQHAQEIHKIMSKTQINGAKINIEMLNQNLAIKLKEALNSLQQNKVIGEKLDKEQEKQNELQQDEKCFKCRRHCRTRSVMCKNNHWVHYKCDKLDEKEIEVIEQSEHNYVCKTCTNEAFDSRNNFEQLAILDNNCAINKSELSIADMMLQEEIQCYACNNFEQSVENRCLICDMPFHDNCLDNDTQKCYSCIGLSEQRDLSDKTQQQTHQTIPKSIEIETETISLSKSEQINISSETTPKNIQPESRPTVGIVQRAEIRQPTQTESTNLIIDDSTYTVIADRNKLDENHKIRMKELKQLEQKLKKREEQIKMKEAMINENMKEKTNILDRLHKSEFRNIELENTIKTLYTKIESLQNKPNQHLPEHQSSASKTTDDLVTGIREKVTKYVLSKVDDEINKLQNENKTTNNDSFNRQNKTYDYQQMYPSNQQQHYRQSSYTQNYGEPSATSQYSMYGARYSEPNQYYYRSENEDRNYQNYDQRIPSYFQNQAELETRNICKDNLIEVVPNWTNQDYVQNHISVQNKTTQHSRINDQDIYQLKHNNQPTSDNLYRHTGQALYYQPTRHTDNF
ncbi:interaptin-like [Mytilus edulis]|uniref:interaptin-like n=1 Tax=Mytilus edulis TaxID=6550 RepID=UPI0039F0FF6E